MHWRDAWTGGLFVAIELARRCWLATGQVPTYSVVYGAFATAHIAGVDLCGLGHRCCCWARWYICPACWPGVARRGTVAGWTFQLAVEVLQQLHRVRHQPLRACAPASSRSCCGWMGCSWHLVLEALTALDWVGRSVNGCGGGRSGCA